MSKNWVSSSHPVSDIRDWSVSRRLELRPDFQRKAVWSESARVMLIDTILRNIPMPKIFLHAILRDEATYRRVIDGQQRIKSILEFIDNVYPLGEPYFGEFIGKKFSELPDSVKEDVLSYKIDVNEIRNCSEADLREIYSRVNKYTVALNKQELRRADFPGRFLDLSEELAQLSFFEEAKVFTIASSKRMADVEFASELLAIVLAGAQEKRETLDSFYLKYANWAETEATQTKEVFLKIIGIIDNIFSSDSLSLSKSRFKQKADFYGLFAAIADLLLRQVIIAGKNLDPLRKDIKILDECIAPTSSVPVFAQYAVNCVSQANSQASRNWRKEFLKVFLSGTLCDCFPDRFKVDLYTNIFKSLEVVDMCPPAEHDCPLSNEVLTVFSEDISVTWGIDDKPYQFSNSLLAKKSFLQLAPEHFIAYPDEGGDPPFMYNTGHR